MDNEPATTEEITERRRKKRFRLNLCLILINLLLMAAIAAGVYYAYWETFYQTHFQPGSTVNGKDVSGLTVAEIKEDLFGIKDTYSLTILERDGRSEELTSEMLGRTYVDNDLVERALASQDPLSWYFVRNEEKAYEVSFDMAYSRQKAEESIDHLECLAGDIVTPPKDAELSTDADGRYIILEEEQGCQLDEAKMKELIFAALDACDSQVDLEEAGCYLAPTVYSDDASLNLRMNTWNAYLAVNVTYSFGPNTEVVDASLVLPHLKDNDGVITLETDWINTLVYNWGLKYDTFGLKRFFTTHDGTTILLPGGGDYGWVINKEKTSADVLDAINTGAQGERDPIFLYSAMGWDNGDLTGTYVEVSIPDQHLWCYKDYVCVMETDVVTGRPTEESATVPGCWAIDGKKEDAVLGRMDVQGYESPVSFWLPFNGGQGLHDAPWRYSFGGTIYKYNGSHGCVNIPVEVMQVIFDTIEIGMAVVVYEDKTPVELPDELIGQN